MAGDDYPKRKGHFAHKAVRLMFRTCAAQEIGHHALSLVTLIAHTEDAKRYTAPATFWNYQLESVLAFSWDKLDRARRRAVEAGWLHYEKGGKAKVGKYWAMIPAQFAGLDDVPIDDDADVSFRTGADTSGGETEKEAVSICTSAERSRGQTRKEAGDKPGKKPGTNPDHSTLSLNPTPKPKPPPSSEAAAADGVSRKAKELLRLWNATPGIKAARSMGPSRVASLNARLTEDARWWDSVPAALQRVSRSSFCRGGGDRRWIAHIKWFLGRETMNKILEGEYDDKEPVVASESPPSLGFKLDGE